MTLTKDGHDALLIAFDVVLIAAQSELDPYMTNQADGFIAALAALDPPLVVIEREPLRWLVEAAREHGLCSCTSVDPKGPRPVGDGRFYHYQDCDNDPALRDALKAFDG